MFRTFVERLARALRPTFKTVWVGMIHEEEGFARVAELRVGEHTINNWILVFRVGEELVVLHHLLNTKHTDVRPEKRMIEALFHTFGHDFPLPGGRLYLHSNASVVIGQVRYRCFTTQHAMQSWLSEEGVMLEETPFDALLDRQGL